jgi:hypothetical protein
MTDKAMSPLRRRMIEDMTIRKFAHKTQHDYVQRVKKFAAFLGRSPATAKLEDLRRYRLHLASSGAGTRKDRHAMLSPHLLELLRAWYKTARPQGCRQRRPPRRSRSGRGRRLRSAFFASDPPESSVAKSREMIYFQRFETRRGASKLRRLYVSWRFYIGLGAAHQHSARRIRSPGCCARAWSGHTVAAPISVMNSRLFN